MINSVFRPMSEVSVVNEREWQVTTILVIINVMSKYSHLKGIKKAVIVIPRPIKKFPVAKLLWKGLR